MLNSLFVYKNGKRHVLLLLAHVARRPLARIVRIFGFVGLNCTDDSGYQSTVNGIYHTFSFLNPMLYFNYHIRSHGCYRWESQTKHCCIFLELVTLPVL